MKRWSSFLVYGWAILTFGLFFAIVIGAAAAWLFPEWKYAEKIVQAMTLSALIIPVTISLYKQWYRNTDQANTNVYVFSKFFHILTGLLVPIGLTVGSLLVMNALDWIDLGNWHFPGTWLGALALNFGIALFYEALPEEIIMRGFIYDVLRHKLSVWSSVLMQAIIFLAFSAGTTLLLVLAELSSLTNLIMLPSELILHFFFAIALALFRVWTKSLWASIGFHLGYLMMARFIIHSNTYGVPAIVGYHNNIAPGFGELLLTIAIIPGAIGVLLVLLLVRRLKG